MELINWNNFTPDSFTQFCNALLIAEVGKDINVFSAPGKDGGIDASFTGEYQNRQGSWRFQYKFHKVLRKQGFYSLKQEVASETEKLKCEDFFVLITNVELLPQENKQLEDIFEKQKAEISPNTTFIIWDGAKLQSLLIGYPLISYWLDEGFETAQLQDYNLFFRRGLESENFEPNTLSNIFIGREKVFNELFAFLSSYKSTIIVQGEAGIGKTRLLIEFFRMLDEKGSGWTILVLANKNVDFDRIKKAMSDLRKYIVMVDDAHSYDARDISDLLRISESSQGNIKLFLTARSLDAPGSLQHIKEYEQQNLAKISLTTLDRAETQAALEPYIKGSSYFHHVGDLIQITYGRPILIVAVLRAINERTRIEKIKQTDFLKTYVHNYFDGFLRELQQLTGISKLRSQRLLQNIALIEPFSYEDQKIISTLANIHKLHHTEITSALNLLKNHSYVSGRYEQSIRPDYYSDIILQEINVADASDYVMDFGSQLDNIVVNLSSVDEIRTDKSALLDDILKTYVGWIEQIDNGEEYTIERKIHIIGRILNTIGRITFVKPKIAKQAVDNYVASLTNPSHPVSQELTSNSQTGFHASDNLLNKVSIILARLFLNPDYFGYVYETSFRLFEKGGEKNIVPIFSYGKRDILEQYALTRQRYIVSRLSAEADRMTSSGYKFTREILKSMLNLEFTVTENSAVARDSLTITTFRLPSSDNVKDLRILIANLLMKFYDLPQFLTDRLETLKLILDIPRGIFATEKNNRPYQNDNEIRVALDFLENRGSDFTLMEQRETLDKLFWFTKWDTKGKFSQEIKKIKVRLKPKDLSERLSQLFSSNQVSLLRTPDIHGYISEQCDSIAASSSEDELAAAMQKFLEPQPYPPHFFWEFLRHLEIRYISHAVRFHDLLFDSKSPLYYQYASSILSALRFSGNGDDLYWNRIRNILSLDTWQADNVVLLSYGARVPGTSILEGRDIDVIVDIYNKNRVENNFALASGLQSIIAAGDDRTYEILGGYLDRAGQKDAEMFFIWLTDNKTASAELVRFLTLEKTVRFYLSYEIERGLAFVLEHFGIQTVFEYLEKRFDFKRNEVQATRSLLGYEFLPDGEYSQLFEQFPEKKTELFRLALDWFLSTDVDRAHLFYGKDMLVYLQPGQSINDDTYTLYLDIINKVGEDLIALEKIADTLSIFHIKDSRLVELIAKIYSLALKVRTQNQETFENLYYALHHAITAVGVKSGQAGLPFQVDLDLRDLLTRELGQLSEFDETRHLLKEALANIENDINRNLDRDNETW